MAVLVLAVTPGAGVFVVASKAITEGYKQAIPVIIGVIFGDLFFLLLVIYGLSAIAALFNLLFLAIKYAGALFLIGLGIKLWRTMPNSSHTRETRAHAEKYNFLVGLSITLGNPKVILFYLALLPAMIDVTALSGIDVIVVVCVVSVILGSVLLIYAYCASRASRMLDSPNVKNGINKIAGGMMIGAGSTLLVRT
jgi:threonine/homoserine/homoserine lactone efflux protein